MVIKNSGKFGIPEEKLEQSPSKTSETDLVFYAMGLKISMPFEFKTLPSRVDTLEKQVKQMRLVFDRLGLEQLHEYEPTVIDKADVKAKILKLIQLKKEEGHGGISDFEIMRQIGLPIEAVDELIAELEREGILRERRN